MDMDSMISTQCWVFQKIAGRSTEPLRLVFAFLHLFS